ncbi:MAG: dihydrolipoyl dehydrogenase [Halioglobus sp.]|nr:dihydrolipoyl dehydrogenase [Halioglobus sp.]
MSDPKLDIAIIGAGPGGYVAAIRAAQLGLKVVVIEMDTPGGVCLNWGCIPSKNLIQQAEDYHVLHALEKLGVKVDRSGLDYGKVHANSRAAAKTLAGGVSGLLRKNKVKVIKGRARLAGPGKIAIAGGETLSAANILIATGSRPMAVPGFEFDEKQVLSSTGILDMKTLPGSLVILGGGAIGCEFAFVMNAFGVAVTVVEMAEHLLPTEDFECAAVVAAEFEKAGITVHTATRATSLTRSAKGVSAALATPRGDTTVNADKALVVFGRRPNTDDLGLETVGLQTDSRGFIPVAEYNQTATRGVFAIGDVTNTPLLAHVASREGELAVEFIAGHAGGMKAVDPAAVPSAIYCEPQVAGFGLREDEARSKGIDIRKSVFPYRGIGKAVAVGKSEGLVKLIADPKTGEILGGHVVGLNATEILHEILLAKTAELLPEDITRMIHAHPTLSEGVMEAALGLTGAPIHM